MDSYVKDSLARKIRNAIFISWLNGSCGANWQKYAENIVWGNRS